LSHHPVGAGIHPRRGMPTAPDRAGAATATPSAAATARSPPTTAGATSR